MLFIHNTARRIALGLVISTSSLTLVACSGSDPSAQVPTLNTPHASTANSTTAREKAEEDEDAYLAKMREFVDCVRESGFPDMSDPTELGEIFRDDLVQLQDAEGKTILKRCFPIIDGLPVPRELEKKRFAEQAGTLTDKQKAANIAFAECMQQNGVPEYPDPQPNGLQVTEPWTLPNATVARPAGLQGALDICHRILDPTDP